jgi:hypothetical protein
MSGVLRAQGWRRHRQRRANRAERLAVIAPSIGTHSRARTHARTLTHARTHTHAGLGHICAETLPHLHRDSAVTSAPQVADGVVAAERVRRHGRGTTQRGVPPTSVGRRLGSPPPTSAPGLGSSLPHLRRDLGPPLPHLHRDLGTVPAQMWAGVSPGCGRRWAHPRPHLRRDSPGSPSPRCVHARSRARAPHAHPHAVRSAPRARTHDGRLRACTHRGRWRLRTTAAQARERKESGNALYRDYTHPPRGGLLSLAVRAWVGRRPCAASVRHSSGRCGLCVAVLCA